MQCDYYMYQLMYIYSLLYKSGTKHRQLIAKIYSDGKKNPDLLLFYQKRTNKSEMVKLITKNNSVCT